MSIALKNVNITGGFWKKFEEMNRNVTINAVYDRFAETGRFKAMHCTWKPDSDEPMPHFFWDSDVAKWVEGASYILAKHERPDLEEKIEDVIDAIEENQQDDGYFNVYFTVVEPQNKFQHRQDHELYCAGHLIEAAVAYYEATGKDRFLKLMEKYADCIEEAFVTKKTANFITPGHEELELALLRLYRCTKKDKYLELCKHFINARGQQKESCYEWANEAYDQHNLPLRELSLAEGHSVRALYLYTAMADLAKETGDSELLEACKRLFDDIVHKKMYITGGVGSTHIGESFTVSYDLPAEQAYTETCAAIALVFFSQKMLENEINSQYADVIERVIYNGMLSGISYNGKAFFYENPLEINLTNHSKNTATVEKERLPITQRLEVFECSCCPPNINRVLSSMEQYIYSKRDDTYYVHQFMQSELTDGDVRISQTTDYPDNGKIIITANNVKTLALRIPAWCQHFDINCEYTLSNGYAYIHNPEMVEVNFEMNPVLYGANAEVNECIGKASLAYGPVVYCAEGVDNGNLNLHRMYLSENLNAELSCLPELDTTMITVDGFYLSTRDDLYAPLAKSFKPTRIKMIPYRLFANRGETDMLVWLNVK